MRETEKIWMNGELVDWADARIHVGAHGLHYGSGVFEGIRAYETDKGSAVFRLTDHLQRLHNSARLLHMELPFSVEELRASCHELIAANGLPECYLRPIAFFGYGELGVSALGNPVDVVIMSWPWGAYLGEEGLAKGIRAKISSWTRIGPNVIPHVAKATGVYLNSMLAVTEANRAGYDEAILLTAEGYVADGSGENIFIVKNGEIYTPDLSTSILPGITRDTVIQIAQDLGYTVAREGADPLRPLPRRRGVHDRHRRRGDAAPLGRRRRDRGRADHARDPEGVPGHRARPQRALGPVARLRHARAGRGLSTGLREIPLARPLLDEREEELVLEVLRSGRLSLGPTIDRFEELSPSASARPTRPPSRAAPPACTCSAGSPGSGRATRRSPRRSRSPRARTASSSRARRPSSPTSTRAR